jgi:hypothetical protein
MQHPLRKTEQPIAEGPLSWQTNYRSWRQICQKSHFRSRKYRWVGNMNSDIFSHWDGHYALCTKGNTFHPPTSTSWMLTMTNRFYLKNCISKLCTPVIWWLSWLWWSWWQQQWQQKLWQCHKLPQCFPSNSTQFPVCQTTYPLTCCKLCLYPQHY